VTLTILLSKRYC